MRLLALDAEGIQEELAHMEKDSKSLRRSIHELAVISEGKFSLGDFWMMTADSRSMVVQIFTEQAERRRGSM